MSIFKKAWKGIKGAFKSIAKGVKSAAKKVGKFMDKIGIVGQIGLMFILPGMGNFIAKGLGTMTGALASASNPLLSGVGKIMQTAGKFANTAGNAYKTVTEAVSGFVSNVGKGMVNRAGSLLGKEGLVFSNGPATVTEGFKSWMTGVADDVQNIASPFRAPAQAVESSISDNYSRILEPDDLETFDPADMFTQKDEDFKFYEVPRDQYMEVVSQERKGFAKFVGDVGSYARKTITNLPERAIDTAADAAVTGVEDATLGALGVETQPTYNTTYSTVNIPQFRSAPIQSSYESSGLNYGATPESRLQYYAANQVGGDFGAGAFNTYAGIRG